MSSREDFWVACYLEHFKINNKGQSDLTSESSAYFAGVSLKEFDETFKKENQK